MRLIIAHEIDASHGDAIQWALDRTTEYDVAYLTAVPMPSLYECGVRYAVEPWTGQCEEFATVPIVFERRWGDCDDLCAWRAAELYLRGIRARAQIIETPTSTPSARHWHCVIRYADGRIEDPSALLGMGRL